MGALDTAKANGAKRLDKERREKVESIVGCEPVFRYFGKGFSDSGGYTICIAIADKFLGLAFLSPKDKQGATRALLRAIATGRLLKAMDGEYNYVVEINGYELYSREPELRSEKLQDLWEDYFPYVLNTYVGYREKRRNNIDQRKR